MGTEFVWIVKQVLWSSADNARYTDDNLYWIQEGMNMIERARVEDLIKALDKKIRLV